ncbi:LysE family translocator [uncultured Desulfuromusa sp.]|uniref:LysE family translocator n=1 Tax=uncultured Desulfuromusa sp. TaxID=219183 RepID=UPI002AA60B8C|nr:LysE family translocator [uncultured Desulfuromusa sp.]
MNLFSTLTFAIAMLILAASPGPGVFATVSRSLSSGFRPALTVITGIILGDIIFLLFAIFGLAFLAQTLGHFFNIVKLLGGGYLIWQGIKIFRSDAGLTDANAKAATSKAGNFIAGLFITLGNPKVILFYCGFLPTFVSLTELTLSDIFIIIAVITTVLAAVLGSYAWLASSARKLLKTPHQVKRLNRVAGGIMATTGIIIASRS